MIDPDTPLTERLNAAERDDHALMAYVYAEMQRLARQALRRSERGVTLQTGAVVNEAYLKLFGQGRQQFRDRGHFQAIAATAMRQILVDHARARLADKRGAGQLFATPTLDEGEIDLDADALQLVAIDAALTELARLDGRASQVFELRFFAGLDIDEVAAALGVSAPTVKRDARFARVFIAERLGWQPKA
ncbi:MAG: ECF-type sigma factor [Lysobacterales bacterium]